MHHKELLASVRRKGRRGGATDAEAETRRVLGLIRGGKQKFPESITFDSQKVAQIREQLATGTYPEKENLRTVVKRICVAIDRQ